MGRKNKNQVFVFLLGFNTFVISLINALFSFLSLIGKILTLVPVFIVLLLLILITTMRVSVPEPPPTVGGEVVPDVLINYLTLFKDEHKDNIPDPARDKFIVNMDGLVSLIHQRDNFGRAKYGQPLMSEDGRNGVEDAKQELGDLLQYLMKCQLGGPEVISEEDKDLFITGFMVATQILNGK